MTQRNRPEIGITMYHVLEHLYYISEKMAPVREYVVREARVTGFFKGGYTEVCLTGPNDEGSATPFRYKLSDIEKRLFYTPQGAAALAKRETERYERTWGWLGTPDIPLRRPWENLLLET